MKIRNILLIVSLMGGVAVAAPPTNPVPHHPEKLIQQNRERIKHYNEAAEYLAKEGMPGPSMKLRQQAKRMEFQMNGRVRNYRAKHMAHHRHHQASDTKQPATKVNDQVRGKTPSPKSACPKKSRAQTSCRKVDGPKVSPKNCPKSSPKACPKNCPKASPKNCPKTNPKARSKNCPKARLKACPKASSKNCPKSSPKASPKGCPKTLTPKKKAQGGDQIKKIQPAIKGQQRWKRIQPQGSPELLRRVMQSEKQMKQLNQRLVRIERALRASQATKNKAKSRADGPKKDQKKKEKMREKKSKKSKDRMSEDS